MDLLALWEKGRGLPAQGKALLLAEAALPLATREEAAALPVGQRDFAITGLRRAIAGDAVHGRAACPACRETAEVHFGLDATEAAAGPAGTHELPGGTSFRLPDTLDLDAASRMTTLSAARQVLVDRCIGEGAAEEIVAQVADRMAQLDAAADICLELICPACQHHWEVAFDIAQFFWQETSLCARRLLAEVHELALAYGWSEADVLGMSAGRRQAYLELVRG
jgi:hypothetical protein